MATNKAKLMKAAPILVVLGLATYAVWSNRNSGWTNNKPETLPSISPALLRPSLPPAPEHNPFVLKQQPVVARPSPPSEIQVDLSASVRSMTLNATCLSGGTGEAMINGHLYAVGDAVAQAAGSKDLILAEVFEDRVRLAQGDRSVDLAFPERSSTHARTPTKTDSRKTEKTQPTAQPAKAGLPK